MGLMTEQQYIEQNGIPNNMVEVRLRPNHMIFPDVKIFPIYCSQCKKLQSQFYVHCGSRYGQVGSVGCEFCGEQIYVTDRDNLVDCITIGGRELLFRKLYLLDWELIQKLGLDKAQVIAKALEPYRGKYLTVYQLCFAVEKAMEIKNYPMYSYATDEEFSVLPEDINRWISLLEALDIELPEYVRRKET